ncbi:hypothetical protein GH722_04950 [Alphaproteobacteria bacterium HT1-32]|nr:hypothetical protein [Alphaproteobacteria bacterium HT1-32]
MYEEEKWRDVPAALANKIIGTVRDAGAKYPKLTDAARAHECPLPFYQDAPLIRLTDTGGSNDQPPLYFLMEQDELYPLDGHSIAIHEYNAKVSINLTRDNVVEYLRFLGFFIESDHGPFLVAESIDDPIVPLDLTEQTRRVFERELKPVVIKSETEQGHFLLEATVLYANQLSAAKFEVKPDGTVDMIENEGLAADLQIRDDC